MKEIEVKAKINNIENIKEKLAELGCEFSVPLIQEDIIFLPAGIEYNGIVKGTPVVRVRNSNDIATLTLKKRVIADNELIKLEKEIIVSDKQEAIDIIENMDFHEVVRVNKKRIQCKYKGMTVCLDEVEGLGNFIEVEKMSEEDNDEMIQDQLFDFLQSLGFDEDDRITKGYDTLIYENK